MQVAGPHLGVQGCPPGVQIASNRGAVGHGETAGRQFWEEKVHVAGCSESKREGKGIPFFTLTALNMVLYILK